MRFKVFFLFFFCSSCIEDISPNLGDNPKQVAVYCIFEENKPWKLVLQNTQQVGRANSTDTDPIKDALVEIRGDDGSYRKLEHLADGLYEGNENLPHTQVKYDLIVYTGGKSITANATLPNKILIEDAEFIASEIDNLGQGGEIIKWKLKFLKDKTFFKIDSFLNNFGIRNPEFQTQIDEQFYTSPFSTGNNVVYGNGIFLAVQGTALGLNMQTTISEGRYGFTFTALSDVAFEHFKKIKQQQFIDGNLFTEPLNSTTNIYNGVGVFSGIVKTNFGTYQPRTIVGKYRLKLYNSQINGVQTDWIQKGAAINIELFTDGRVQGDYKYSTSENVKNFVGWWYTDLSGRTKLFIPTDNKQAFMDIGFPGGAYYNRETQNGLGISFEKID